jgi:hypothetical protein
MAEANETKPDPTPEPKDDVTFYKSEAQKAFKARDDLKLKLRDLESRTLSEDDRALFDTLKAQQAKAEEDRAKKAGEFESLKQSLIKKHQDELDAERTARKALETSYVQEKIEGAFLGATDWFGGDSAKTILTGDMANAYLGKYVSYEDIELAGKTVKAVVVRDLEGNVILDGKGNPARFSDAIGDLISQLPTKDRILRGGGKTGSGSSGGVSHVGHAATVDVRQTQRADTFRDPKARAELKRQMATAGGLQIGPAFDRIGR